MNNRNGVKAVLISVLAGLALAVPASAQAQTYGFEPGSFFARAHEPVTHVSQYGLGANPFDTRVAVTGAQEVLQAGAHPDASTGFKITRAANGWPSATKDIMVDGPPGFVGSTVAVPVCPMEKFLSEGYGNCPTLTQVGISVAWVGTPGTEGASSPGENGSMSAIFKLPPPPGAPARFGYRTAGGQVVYLIPRLRSDGDYGLRVFVDNLPSNFGIVESVSTLWGVPYDPIHDVHRWKPPTPGSGNNLGGFGGSVSADEVASRC